MSEYMLCLQGLNYDFEKCKDVVHGSKQIFVVYIPGLILTWFHTAQIPETIKNITFLPFIPAELFSL